MKWVAALAIWSAPDKQQILVNLRQLNDHIANGKVRDMPSLHQALEEELGKKLSPKDVAAMLSLLNIFLG